MIYFGDRIIIKFRSLECSLGGSVNRIIRSGQRDASALTAASLIDAIITVSKLIKTVLEIVNGYKEFSFTGP